MPFAHYFASTILAMAALTYFPKATVLALSALVPLFVLSKLSSPVRYYFRLTAFLLGLGTASVWGVLVSLAMSVIPGQSKNINWVVARSFHGLVAPWVGFNFTVKGEQHLDTTPAIVIGNHQTMIDILCQSSLPPPSISSFHAANSHQLTPDFTLSFPSLYSTPTTLRHYDYDYDADDADLGRIFPKGCSIMAKKELQYTPLLGQFMTLSNAVFVNRSRRADAVAVFAKVATTMKEKIVSPSQHILRSAFRLSDPMACDVVVVIYLPGRNEISIRYANSTSVQKRRFPSRCCGATSHHPHRLRELLGCVLGEGSNVQRR